MDTRQMLTELEAEIALLQQVRELLAGAGSATTGRVPATAPALRGGGRRPLSSEARERIAAAQRARWAKSKRAAKRAAKKAAKSSANSAAKSTGRGAAKKAAKKSARRGRKAAKKSAVKRVGRRSTAKKAPAKRTMKRGRRAVASVTATSAPAPQNTAS